MRELGTRLLLILVVITGIASSTLAVASAQTRFISTPPDASAERDDEPAFDPITRSRATERECGQHLRGPDRVVVRATCIERDLNQRLASCRTCQNVAYVGVLVGFSGLAYNVNSGEPEHYHLWQYVGQTSAGYLAYTINTSRGGLLRWWGMTWVANSGFQAVVNKAAGLCDAWCWTDREPATWDLEGVAVPKLWHGSARRWQFGIGASMIAAGLALDVWDWVYPESGRTAPVVFNFQMRPGGGALTITRRLR